MTTPSVLRNVPLFSQLRDSDLERLARDMRTRAYPKKSVIISAHQAGDTFYILLSGQVKVMLIGEDGREVMLTLIRSGDFFGEMSLVDDELSPATVIAMEDSQLLLLHRDDFRRFLAELPGVAFGLLRALCTRLRDADSKIGGLILLDVPGRVARLFLRLADENDGVQVPKPPTHQVIAQMVGSSRETVSRTIRQFATQQLIETSRQRVVIKDRRALERIAGLYPPLSELYDRQHERRRSA
jgi:CRP/FNR family transcriptional regulator, cyclic AMP receptor protein